MTAFALALLFFTAPAADAGAISRLPAFALHDRGFSDRDAAVLRAFSAASDWSLPKLGVTSFEDEAWKREDEGSGVEMFTRRPSSHGPSEEKRVVLREAGALNSASRYALWKTGRGRPREESATVTFDGAEGWTSLTRCADAGESSGRSCVTVTPQLCAQAIDKQIKLSETELGALEKYEVRAIALILTLRGVDHQLDNVVRFGNRMGVKDPGQTTKGRLLRPQAYPSFARKLRAACETI